MKRNIPNSIVSVLLLMIIIFSSCSSTTQTTAKWTSPQRAPGGYKNFLLVGLTNNVPARETVEGELEVQLFKIGVNSQKSIKVFPPSMSNANSVNKEKILEVVKSNGDDAILTLSLVNKETETRYIPGSYGYDPAFRYDYYGSFGGYYSYWSPYAYDPGYYVNEKIYFLETNVYDAKTEKLIWSAQSKTYDPKDIETFAAEYSRSLIKELIKDGIIKKQ